jgi:hypothetical protein
MEDAAFKEARDAFLTSLQPRERQLFQSCKTSKELLSDLQKHKAFKAKQNLIRRSAANIEKFGESLTPFFGAIGFFAQANPEIAGTVWGSVRLVIQVRQCGIVWHVLLIISAGQQLQFLLSQINRHVRPPDAGIPYIRWDTAGFHGKGPSPSIEGVHSLCLYGPTPFPTRRD